MNPFQEFLRCQDDFKYFATTYLKISHPTKGLIPFELYPYQESLARDYENQRFVSVIKFRQGGFTTFTGLWAMWKCMFHQDQRFFFGCKTDREAVHLGRIVGRAVQNMPEWFKPPMAKCNEHVKEFSVTGSRMEFFTIEAACAKAVTHLVIDEAAFIPNMEEKWKMIYPTLSTGGKCFVLSTTNGIGNWFFDICQKSLQGKNSFHLFETNYKDHPDFAKPGWEEMMRKNMGERAFRQEMLGEFLAPEDAKTLPPRLLREMEGWELADECERIAHKAKLPIGDKYVLLESARKLRNL